VRPSVEGLLRTELRNDPQSLVRLAVRANVGVSVSHLRYGSDVLEQLIENDGLMVVGAEYSLETGVVEFFDDNLPLQDSQAVRSTGKIGGE
jgi:carbonic anhydrase